METALLRLGDWHDGGRDHVTGGWPLPFWRSGVAAVQLYSVAWPTKPNSYVPCVRPSANDSALTTLLLHAAETYGIWRALTSLQQAFSLPAGEERALRGILRITHGRGGTEPTGNIVACPRLKRLKCITISDIWALLLQTSTSFFRLYKL